MAEKFAIYFGEPLAVATAGYETERSARVNAIAADWLEMVAEMAPALSADEWWALADACVAVGIDRDMKLWAELVDLGEEDLGMKLRTLTRLQTLAVLEVAARLILLRGGHDDDAVLRLAGAKLA